MTDQTNTQQKQATTGAAAQTGAQTGAKPPTFDGWFATQDEVVQGVINTRFTALENTVRATREERDTVRAQIKDMAKKAEKGSEFETQLNEALRKLDLSERKSDFMEQALKPEIGCRNPKAAYALAVSDGLFNSKGNPDWAAIKSVAPEIFGKEIPPAHGGDGTGDQIVAGNLGMNALIRRKAGR